MNISQCVVQEIIAIIVTILFLIFAVNSGYVKAVFTEKNIFSRNLFRIEWEVVFVTVLNPYCSDAALLIDNTDHCVHVNIWALGFYTELNNCSSWTLTNKLLLCHGEAARRAAPPLHGALSTSSGGDAAPSCTVPRLDHSSIRRETSTSLTKRGTA